MGYIYIIDGHDNYLLFVFGNLRMCTKDSSKIVSACAYSSGRDTETPEATSSRSQQLTCKTRVSSRIVHVLVKQETCDLALPACVFAACSFAI